MANDTSVTRRSRVFAGIPAEEHQGLLESLRAIDQPYRQGDAIIRIGERMSFFPVMLAGAVQATVPRGTNTQIVERFGPGESFAEAVVMSDGPSPVEIVALTDSRILLLHRKRLLGASQPRAVQLHANLVQEMSKKLVHLSVRLNLLAEPRLRSRILMSLDGFERSTDGAILLPYTRADWADYLGVNPKALMRELRRMQDERLIEVDRKIVRQL